MTLPLITPPGFRVPIAQTADSATTGGNARGANAVDWQTSRTANTNVASGTASTIGGGRSNTADGNDGTVAGGASNRAFTGASVGGGSTNNATGSTSAVAGGTTNTANGANSWIPGGANAQTRSVVGRGAWAAGQFTAAGDAQAGEGVLRVSVSGTTTPTRLTADALSASSVNCFNLPNNGTYLVRLLVVARQTGGSAGTAGDSAGWVAEALLKRGANAAATSLVGGGGASLAPTYNDAAAAAWRLEIAADATNGGVTVTGTGETNKNIRWAARLMSVECAS